MNISAMVERAAELARASKFAEVESICKKILSKKPKQFDALQLLGVAQCNLGRLDLAKDNLEKAVYLDKQHAGVRCNLSRVYLDLKKFDKAIESAKQAIKISPDNYETHFNYANALQECRRYAEAEAAYNKALEINGRSIEAITNLGICRMRQGALEEAIRCFFSALELNTNCTSVMVHIFRCMMLMHLKDDARKMADAALERDDLKLMEKLELLIGKAKIAWLDDNIDVMEGLLAESKMIHNPGFTADEAVNLSAYHHCLQRLDEERKKHSDLYVGDANKTLFFVAESHCLSPANVVVKYKEQIHRISSALITGCKVWHLCDQNRNQYKASLEIIFSQLPAHIPVVLGVGEIDCRSDEGILHAFRKKNMDYHQSIPDMINRYVSYVDGLAKASNRDILFYGVPAPAISFLNKLTPEDRRHLCNIISLFNESLRTACNQRNIALLDVHKLTANENGESNMKYHLDNIHIHSKAIPALFQSIEIM